MFVDTTETIKTEKMFAPLTKLVGVCTWAGLALMSVGG